MLVIYGIGVTILIIKSLVLKCSNISTRTSRPMERAYSKDKTFNKRQVFWFMNNSIDNGVKLFELKKYHESLEIFQNLLKMIRGI